MIEAWASDVSPPVKGANHGRDRYLVLEHMKRFHASLERIDRKCDEIISRVGHLESGVAGLRKDFAHADENSAILGIRMDRINERIERIERRLELS